jgi:hypothetical protein
MPSGWFCSLHLVHLDARSMWQRWPTAWWGGSRQQADMGLVRGRGVVASNGARGRAHHNVICL